MARPGLSVVGGDLCGNATERARSARALVPVRSVPSPTAVTVGDSRAGYTVLQDATLRVATSGVPAAIAWCLPRPGR